MLVDMASLLLSIAIAAILRFDYLPVAKIYHNYLRMHIISSIVGIGLYVFIFYYYRMYQYAWRFAGIHMFRRLIYANTIGIFGLFVTQMVIDGCRFPISVFAILWFVSSVIIGSSRAILRLISLGRKYGQRAIEILKDDKRSKRVVILGTESHSVRVLSTMRDDTYYHYNVIGFLDDRPEAKGLYIGDVMILGHTEILYSLLAEHAVDEVIIALPETSNKQIRSYVLECRRRQIPVRVVPLLRDMLSKETELRLHDFTVEDLLRRPSVEVDSMLAGNYLTGKRVMVTGAGGSIGSELCRQIAAHHPECLVLFGHGENSIHDIFMELRSDYPELTNKIHCVIASISNACRVNQTMELYRPQIVFHAAAHKHVPLMELNEQEAIHNNVIGTTNVAEAAGRHEVERLVLVSTDKAADPCSVMGATKWLCEQSIRVSASNWPNTSYITVRFGNVLGSRGSVVPIFHEQIKRGGPVTVTHPEMTRYFMTIPEAVLLVISAGYVGNSGELYLLDMGLPVRILDLAEDMIRLCGLEPGVDIPIRFSGIREGERLHEQLTSELERIEPAPWKGMSIVHRPKYFEPAEYKAALDRLDRASKFGTAAEVRAIMSEIIPRFSASELPKKNTKMNVAQQISIIDEIADPHSR